MTVTLLIMYLFKIRQMQKIEHLKTSHLIFKNTIHIKVHDIAMIRLGLASHVFLDLSDTLEG